MSLRKVLAACKGHIVLQHSNFRTAICVFESFVCLCGLQGICFLSGKYF